MAYDTEADEVERHVPETFSGVRCAFCKKNTKSTVEFLEQHIGRTHTAEELEQWRAERLNGGGGGCTMSRGRRVKRKRIDESSDGVAVDKQLLNSSSNSNGKAKKRGRPKNNV